jgi:hypothetical protein
VSVVTFLDSLIGLAPAVTLIASQSTVGDFDIQLSKRSARDTLKSGNRNFFIDQLDRFEKLNKSESSFHDLLVETVSKNQMLPLLNYTWLNETLTEVEMGGSLYKKTRDPKHYREERVAGRFFPRWSALSKVINPHVLNEDHEHPITSAIMIAGDSQLEN